MNEERHYPAAAYTPEGELWWQLPFGDEQKIAAWLAFNKVVGDTFTTVELRYSLGDGLSEKSRNDREHFQRRLRELRSRRDGWKFPSVKQDRSLAVGHYRLDRVGWHPALGPRPKDPTKFSARTRREVIERDHYRCTLCGVIAGEPYPEDPERPAALTVGHIIPRDHGGSGDASNLRAECALCNEVSRSDTRVPESFDVLRISIDNLKSADRTRLLQWILGAQRVRDRVDEAYDRYRALSPGDQEMMRQHLQATTRA